MASEQLLSMQERAANGSEAAAREELSNKKIPDVRMLEVDESGLLSLSEHLRVPMMTRRDIAVILYCLAVTDDLPAHLRDRRDELISALQGNDLCPTGVFTRVMAGG